jgi:hypothetical protein
LDLARYLAQFDNVRLATTADNIGILKIFNSVPMSSGDLLIRYERGDDFFKLLKWRSAEFFTIVSLDEDQQINGILTITIKQHWIDEHLKTIAYFSDLRFKNMKSTMRFWRTIAKDLLSDYRKIDEFQHIEGFLLSTLASNERLSHAINDIGHFKKVLGYQMINVFGKLPFVRKAPSFSLREIESFAEIEALLTSYQAASCLGEPLDASIFNESRYQCWLGIFSSEGKLVATAAVVDSSEAKTNVIMRLPWSLKLLIKLARPISRLIGFKGFQEEERFNILYLSHLCFAENLEDSEYRACVQSLADHAFMLKVVGGYHSLAFVDSQDGRLSRALSGFLYQKEKLEIHSTKNLEIKNKACFDYDMSLV